MSDVIDMTRFRRQPEAEKKPKTFRGLGVLIIPPQSSSAFGVLGGNIGINLPTKVAFDAEFDLNLLGREIRSRLGRNLSVESDDDLTVPI
jgi:hypothetical protein